MLANRFAALASGVAAVLVLTGCGTASTHADPPPAKVIAVPGSKVKLIRLSELAIARLGITTAVVRAAKVATNGVAHTCKVIPYSAVIYDNDGSTWSFVKIGPRAYKRERIIVATIEGSTAVLDMGPSLGAAVVTTGAPELLGTEYNISGEE